MKIKVNSFIGLTLLLTILALGSSTNVSAQMEKFEALYVYNISRYVEWPTNFNTDAFVIGIVGNNNDLIDNLENIAGSKSIQGKKVIIKNISSPTQGSACNIVFFSKGSEAKMASYKAVSTNSLFLSESKGALTKGSDLNFIIVGGKLKFELSKSNIADKPLNVSTSLVQLASNVI